MISSLILSLALVGQCGPGGCPYRPTVEILPVPQTLMQVSNLDWGWHQVIYQGGIRWAWGYHIAPFTIACYRFDDPIPQPAIK
jgi:hypothetical protein